MSIGRVSVRQVVGECRLSIGRYMVDVSTDHWITFSSIGNMLVKLWSSIDKVLINVSDDTWLTRKGMRILPATAKYKKSSCQKYTRITKEKASKV